MEIDKFIYDLLFQYDCVILPDFGGFIANYRSAEINQGLNSFSPPGKNILFNRNLLHNDGLLINHISRTEGIEYLKSKNLVFGFVRQTIKKLEKGEQVKFSNIGLFYFDRQRNLQFEPDTSVNFLLDAYGLPAFHFPAIKEHDIKKQLRRTYSTAKNTRAVRRISPGRKAVVGVAIILALIFVPVKNHFIRNSSRNYTALFPVPSVTYVVAPPSDSTNTTPDTASFKSEVTTDKYVTVTQKNIEERARDIAPPPVTDTRKSFYVIAGSFRTINSALKYKEELLLKGFKSDILDPDNGRIRLTVYSSSDRSEAVNMLTDFRKVVPDCWLLMK